MEQIQFFSAAYRDGRVYMGGKNYPAGTFATHLLDQYYENDTAARIAVFTTDNWHLEETLEIGYMDCRDFLDAGRRMLNIFQALPWLSPFGMLDTDAERERVARLFTEETYTKITEYWHRKAEVYGMTDEQAWLDRIPKSYDKDFMTEARDLLNEVFFTLDFYNDLKEDMRNAFHALREFVSRVDEAERFDEAHLLPIAMEVFGPVPFPVTTEYVPVKKSTRSKGETLARRLYFDNYYSFVITDFFEGLHSGHYPRQCGICKKYFLMTSAARQKYCNGNAPSTVKGKTITCRKYAARINRKELAEGNPVIRIYKNRCSAIRVERQRVKIDDTLAKAALALAKEYMQRAKNDPVYAGGQYETDMSRNNLYTEADRRLNGK